MNPNQIPTEIVERINKKYGTKLLRKFLGYYDAGIPEKYWQKEDNNYLEKLKKLTEIGANVVVISKTVSDSDDLCYNYVKSRCDDKLKCKTIDFIALNALLFDRFQQVNLDVLNQFNKCDLVCIVGLKYYGKIYDKFYPVITSIVNSMIHNSAFAKQVIFSIQAEDGDVDLVIKNNFGDEFMEMIASDFEFFSINK